MYRIYKAIYDKFIITITKINTYHFKEFLSKNFGAQLNN